MEGRKEREAPMAGCFREEKVAPVLESSTTLKRVKMNFTADNFFLFNPVTVHSIIRCTNASVFK
jgi:hypothetical protein